MELSTGGYWRKISEDFWNNYIEENKNSKDKIKNLENWLIFLDDLLFDYDGLNNVKDLKGLIDDARDFIKRALSGEEFKCDKKVE